MELDENMTVYVLANEDYRFIGLMELGSSRQWIYGFTSTEKAKTFLRMARQEGLLEKANRLFPCTLAEYFEMQEKKKLPDLAIDPDPEQHRNHPMMVGDMAKHNMSCLTVDLPQGGKLYKVAVSERDDVATG